MAQKLSRVVSAGSRVGAVFSLHASVASLNAEMAGGCGVRASPCPLHFSCCWWPQMAEIQGIRVVRGSRHVCDASLKHVFVFACLCSQVRSGAMPPPSLAPCPLAATPTTATTAPRQWGSLCVVAPNRYPVALCFPILSPSFVCPCLPQCAPVCGRHLACFPLSFSMWFTSSMNGVLFPLVGAGVVWSPSLHSSGRWVSGARGQ